ncbi:MAG: hypothetical protein KGS72_20395 [Cyanobacteria bacterium REEB67]|nr:hypothetical protein [Cyanobacteria bacterium REEB67]
MDLESMRPIGTAVVLLCLGGMGVLAFIKKNGEYKKRSAAQPFIGSYPRSPMPITVGMDRATARRKFIDGLRQMQINQGWSISSGDPNSSRFTATMRWSSRLVDRDYRGHNRQTTQLDSTLVLKADFVSQGAQTLCQWSYDQTATSWNDPSNHRLDPKAEEYAAEANYQILKALGLISA